MSTGFNRVELPDLDLPQADQEAYDFWLILQAYNDTLNDSLGKVSKVQNFPLAYHV
jgi:hypothetical protein